MKKIDHCYWTAWNLSISFYGEACPKWIQDIIGESQSGENTKIKTDPGQSRMGDVLDELEEDKNEIN